MATSEQDLTRQRQGSPPVTRDEIQEMFRNFLSNRNFTPEQGGAHLYADNATLRADKRNLQNEVDELRAKVPSADAVVLKGDDVKLFNDLKALIPEGKKVEDLAETLKEHGQLTLKVTELERGNLVRDIAEEEGWKASNLLRLTAGMELTMEEVEEEVDDPEKEGEKKKIKAKRGFLVVKDATGAVTSRKRLSEELADFLPSLKAETGGSTDSGEESKGTSYVRQPAGRKADPKNATKNVSASYLKKAYGEPDKK